MRIFENSVLRRDEMKGEGKMRSFVVCIRHQMLLAWSDLRGWDLRGMCSARGGLKMRVEFGFRSRK
jgi:hypothetical protein